MKKQTSSIMLLLIILALLCSTASADTITAMATEINPEHLEKVSSYARILGYNEETNTLTVELTAPEVFARDEVLALQVGDSIYTGGREIVIRTVEHDDRLGCIDIEINCGDASGLADDHIYLIEDEDGNYKNQIGMGEYTWITVAVIECSVKDSLVFLDYDDERFAQGKLILPRVCSAQELVEKMVTAQASGPYFGLANDNVYVVFDREGNLAIIAQYFISWE